MCTSRESWFGRTINLPSDGGSRLWPGVEFVRIDVADLVHTMNTTSLCCLLIALFSAAPAIAENGGGIRWSITPYIWASETKFDLKADGTPIDSDTITFSDLVDVTDASFQIVVEGGRSTGNWSAFVDVTYLETSDKVSTGPVQIKTDAEQLYVDAAIAYWPAGQAVGLNLFGGVRYTSLDDRFKFSIPAIGVPLGTLKNDRSFTDLLLGGRYRFDFNGSGRFKLVPTTRSAIQMASSRCRRSCDTPLAKIGNTAFCLDTGTRKPNSKLEVWRRTTNTKDPLRVSTSGSEGTLLSFVSQTRRKPDVRFISESMVFSRSGGS